MCGQFTTTTTGHRRRLDYDSYPPPSVSILRTASEFQLPPSCAHYFFARRVSVSLRSRAETFFESTAPCFCPSLRTAMQQNSTRYPVEGGFATRSNEKTPQVTAVTRTKKSAVLRGETGQNTGKTTHHTSYWYPFCKKK